MNKKQLIFYPRDFSQRVITEFLGEKEITIIIDYLSTGNPDLEIVLAKKEKEYLNSNKKEKLISMNNLLKEYNLLTRKESNEKRR